MVSQTIQTSCNQSAIADFSSYASYKPLDSLWSTDVIVKIIRFWNISNSNNSGDLNNAKILTESLQGYSIVSNIELNLSGNVLELKYIFKHLSLYLNLY